MGSPPKTSAVFLIAVIFIKRGHLEEISEMPLLPLRGTSVSGMYVFCQHNSFQFLVSFFLVVDEYTAGRSANLLMAHLAVWWKFWASQRN
jgi:hypothetical protein